MKHLKTYNETKITFNKDKYIIYKNNSELLKKCIYLLDNYGEKSLYSSYITVKISIPGSELTKYTGTLTKKIDKNTFIYPDENYHLIIRKETLGTTINIIRVCLFSTEITAIYLENMTDYFSNKVIEFILSQDINSYLEANKLGLY